MPTPYPIYVAQPDGFIRREMGYFEGKAWVTVSQRLATNEEISPMKQPTSAPTDMPPPATTKPPTSGSHGTHARLNASGAKQWTTCTASPSYCEANQDRILPDKIGKVIKLTDYLKSLPPEEVQPYEVRAMAVAAKWAGPKGKKILSVSEIADIERTESSEAAREGTRAHDYAEAIMRGRKKLSDIPEEFQPHVKAYLVHCKSITPHGVMPLIESKVPLFYSPGDTGTVDFAVVTDERVIIRDLKYGAGVKVDAEENAQLAIYALGLVSMLESDPDMPQLFNPLSTIIDIGIVQPRHHEGGEIRTWELTLNDLRRFCYDIGLAAKRIQSGDVEFCPGEDTCRWCDAKSFCDARQAAVNASHDTIDSIGVDYLEALPDIPAKDAKAMTVDERLSVRRTTANDELCMPDSSAIVLSDDRVMKVFESAAAIRAWLDDICEHVENRALAGDLFGGRVKLVLGRQGNSAWKDETAAETFLKGQGLKEAERFDYKLKSPTKAKEILGDRLKVKRTANRFAELVGRSEAKPVVALASDKRPAITPAFDALPDLDDGPTPENGGPCEGGAPQAEEEFAL